MSDPRAPFQFPPHRFLPHSPRLLPASTQRSWGRSRGARGAAEAGPRPHLPRPQPLLSSPPTQPGGSSPRSPHGRRAPHRCRLPAPCRPPPPRPASPPHLSRNLNPPQSKVSLLHLCSPSSAQPHLPPSPAPTRSGGGPSPPTSHHPNPGRVQAAPPPHRRPLPAGRGCAADAPQSHSRPRRTCGPGVRRREFGALTPLNRQRGLVRGRGMLCPPPPQCSDVMALERPVPGGRVHSDPLRKVHSVTAPRPVPSWCALVLIWVPTFPFLLLSLFSSVSRSLSLPFNVSVSLSPNSPPTPAISGSLYFLSPGLCSLSPSLCAPSSGLPVVPAHISESPFPDLSVVSLTSLLLSLSPTDPSLHTPLLGPLSISLECCPSGSSTPGWGRGRPFSLFQHPPKSWNRLRGGSPVPV